MSIKNKKQSLLKYNKDVFLVLILISNLFLELWVLLYIDIINIYYIPFLFIILTLFYFYNVIIVNHNFHHTPFFKKKYFNTIFRLLSSITLYYPMSIIDESHRLHHRYANDKKHKGMTKDPLSTYRHGKNEQQENFISYALTNFIRGNRPSDVIRFYKKTSKNILFIEFILVIAFIIFSIFVNAKYFFILIVPSMYVGWVLSDMQNYFEHHLALNNQDRNSNSVSYYGRFYNILMFNEGYHQEHHYSPSTHWSNRPNIKKLMEKKNLNFYVTSFPAILGLLEKIKKKRR